METINAAQVAKNGITATMEPSGNYTRGCYLVWQFVRVQGGTTLYLSQQKA